MSSSSPVDHLVKDEYTVPKFDADISDKNRSPKFQHQFHSKEKLAEEFHSVEVTASKFPFQQWFEEAITIGKVETAHMSLSPNGSVEKPLNFPTDQIPSLLHHNKEISQDTMDSMVSHSLMNTNISLEEGIVANVSFNNISKQEDESLSSNPHFSRPQNSDRTHEMASETPEYNLSRMFPDMGVLLKSKKKELDYGRPEIIQAMYVESETNLLSQWKAKYMKVRPSQGRPPVKNNRSSTLKRTYLQYKRYKKDQETKEVNRLRERFSRGIPDYDAIRTQGTLTSEYRHAFARNRPPIPYHFQEYFQEHKKLPFKIVQIKRNCWPKAPD